MAPQFAHAVGSRRREFGIRMALGADRTRIYRLVLRQGARVTSVGLGLGLLGAGYLTRFLERFLFEVRALDVPTFTPAVAVLLTVTAITIAVPARRATRVDVAESRHME